MDNMEGEFSREFKQQIVENRYKDWENLENWLKENAISYFKDFHKIEIYENICIYSNMKVSFGTSKRYQYNLEGIKQRILN